MTFGYLLAGFALLAGLYILARLFIAASPALLARGTRLALIAAVVLIGLFLLLRVPAVAALLGAAAAFLWRSGMLFRVLPMLGGWLGNRAARAGQRRAAGGSASEVETAWFTMALDHATGQVDGKVRQGPFAGKRLGDLTEEELYSLWLSVRGSDAQSLRLLETFLDRGGEDWRGQFETRAEREGQSGGSPGGPMTREEALSVLGLAAGAGADEIKDAHRTLMKKLHPDHGGSDYFAAKLNQAKALLLGE